MYNSKGMIKGNPRVGVANAVIFGATSTLLPKMFDLVAGGMMSSFATFGILVVSISLVTLWFLWITRSTKGFLVLWGITILLFLCGTIADYTTMIGLGSIVIGLLCCNLLN